MAKIKLYTEDQARDAGFSGEQIESSRAHPDGYLGTNKEGTMSYNSQAELSFGGFEANGRGSRGAMPQMQGEGFPPSYRRSKE